MGEGVGNRVGGRVSSEKKKESEKEGLRHIQIVGGGSFKRKSI